MRVKMVDSRREPKRALMIQHLVQPLRSSYERPRSSAVSSDYTTQPRALTALWIGLLLVVIVPLLGPLLPFTRPTITGIHILGVMSGRIRYTLDSQAYSAFTAYIRQDVGFKWLRTFGIVALVILWERRSIATIGWRRSSTLDIGIVLLSCLTLMFVRRSMDYYFAHPAPSNVQLGVALLPFGLRAAMVVTAAVTEEVERGYLIERLEGLGLSVGAIVGIAWTVFVFEHAASWNISHAIRIVPTAALLVLVYTWRRNLISCVLVHLWVDASVLLRLSDLPAFLFHH